MADKGPTSTAKSRIAKAGGERVENPRCVSWKIIDRPGLYEQPSTNPVVVTLRVKTLFSIRDCDGRGTRKRVGAAADSVPGIRTMQAALVLLFLIFLNCWAAASPESRPARFDAARGMIHDRKNQKWKFRLQIPSLCHHADDEQRAPAADHPIKRASPGALSGQSRGPPGSRDDKVNAILVWTGIAGRRRQRR